MKFVKHDKYSQFSECGRYSVCAIGLGDQRYVYEAWQTRAHPSGPHLIASNIASAAEARQLVEQHDADEP